MNGSKTQISYWRKLVNSLKIIREGGGTGGDRYFMLDT